MTPADAWFLLGLGAVTAALGVLFSLLAQRYRRQAGGLQTRLENLLPGINCGQCAYPGCAGYAQALAAGTCLDPDRCRPGGPETGGVLAAILGLPSGGATDYDSLLFEPRRVAYIHASECNGCGKCARNCRVDAILGTLKQPFRVDPEECIDCGDCQTVCPQECIEKIRLEPTVDHFNWNIRAVRLTEPDV